MSIYLTSNFTFEELTRTDTGLPNEPDGPETDNIRRLAHTAQQGRAILGNRKWNIRSGYRSEAVNKRVGGVETSAHRKGLAVDFTVEGLPLREAFDKLRTSGLVFDQLILEPSWIHLGLSVGRPRQECLTYDGHTYTRV